MNALKLALGLFALISLSAVNGYGQEFTLTTTARNTVSSKATIEVPALSGNPDAVIIATPLGDSETRNPHTIGAWYYSGKWNIFNTDHANLAEGLTYKVQYFLRRDANHFVHVMTKANITGSGSVIDSPALNGNPNAQFTIFQNHAPDDRTGSLNKHAAAAEYDAAGGKWFIKNVNGERLFPDTAYNIVVTSAGRAAVNPSLPIATPYVPVVPITTVPAPNAPLTVVVREEWTIPHQTSLALTPGYCQIIDGYTNPNILITDHVIVTGHQYNQGANLRWTAEVDNGSLRITVCNNAVSGHSTSAHTHVNGKKLNILVLR
jgi:hypothetical protein